MSSLVRSVYLRETKKAGVRGGGEALKIEVSLEVKSLIMQNVNVLLCKVSQAIREIKASLPALQNAGIRIYHDLANLQVTRLIAFSEANVSGNNWLNFSYDISLEGHTNSHTNHKNNDLSQRRRFVFSFPHNSLDACKPGLL